LELHKHNSLQQGQTFGQYLVPKVHSLLALIPTPSRSSIMKRV